MEKRVHQIFVEMSRTMRWHSCSILHHGAEQPAISSLTWLHLLQRFYSNKCIIACRCGRVLGAWQLFETPITGKFAKTTYKKGNAFFISTK